MAASSSPTIAARYVSALLARHTDMQEQDALSRGLGDWADAGKPGSALGDVFANPSLPRQALEGMIVELARRHGASASVTELLTLLARQRRLDLLGEIARQYHARLRALRGQKQAEIVSAAPLSDEQKRPIQEALGQETEIRWREDAALLGGFVLEADGRTMDLSVAGQLRQAARRLGAHAESAAESAKAA